MLSLFQRKRIPPITGAPSASSVATSKGRLSRPESAVSLLATRRRRKLLGHIWQRTSLSRRQFATLYRAPLARAVEATLSLPLPPNARVCPGPGKAGKFTNPQTFFLHFSRYHVSPITDLDNEMGEAPTPGSAIRDTNSSNFPLAPDGMGVSWSCHVHR
ncbi:MAG: TraI domain-containing protein [Gammaproteobacteria bacterium]|nr:TraI domain-containing protein [Gammaproteobacteria bacterium]